MSHSAGCWESRAEGSMWPAVWEFVWDRLLYSSSCRLGSFLFLPHRCTASPLPSSVSNTPHVSMYRCPPPPRLLNKDTSHLGSKLTTMTSLLFDVFSQTPAPPKDCRPELHWGDLGRCYSDVSHPTAESDLKSIALFKSSWKSTFAPRK